MGRNVLSVVACAAIVVFAAPSGAEARKQQDYGYRFEQVWSASVRMVRVDMRFPISDQDESIGYLLFEYRDRGRSHPGSIELVRLNERGQERIKVVVQIPAMPSYIEQMLLDRLGRKLVDEFGQPLPPPRRRPDPPTEEPPADDDEEPPRDRDRPREGDRGPDGPTERD
jgi:hypothetical protein